MDRGLSIVRGACLRFGCCRSTLLAKLRCWRGLASPNHANTFLEGSCQILGLAGGGSAIASLDNLDDMAGMLSRHNRGRPIANPVDELHDILIDVLLHNIEVGADDMLEQDLVAHRVGEGLLATRVVKWVAVEVTPNNRA